MGGARAPRWRPRPQREEGGGICATLFCFLKTPLAGGGTGAAARTGSVCLGRTVKLRQLGLQTELRQGPRREPGSGPAPIAAPQSRSFVSAWRSKTQITCYLAGGSSITKHFKRPALSDVIKGTDTSKPTSNTTTPNQALAKPLSDHFAPLKACKVQHSSNSGLQTEG